MQDAIRAAVLRLFPELSGGLHLDRYGRVVAIADQPGEGVTCERFRPRYAVDVQILTPELEPDPAFPVFPAVPLPVPGGAGQECGTYAFPEPGALVVVGFAYGRPDHPIIRQVYPMGTSLPSVAPREWLAQQSPAVFQRADADGNWTRQTDAAITDESQTRLVRAMEAVTEVAREIRRVSEHSTTEVEGTYTVETGAVLTLLAGLRADLGTLGALNLTAGGDSSHTTAGAATETVGRDHASTVKGSRYITVAGGRSEAVQGGQQTQIGGDRTVAVDGNQSGTVGGDHELTVDGSSTEKAGGDRSIEAANLSLKAGTISCVSTSGSGAGVSLFVELLACLDEIKAALDVLAAHTHPTTTAITEGGAVANHASRLGIHRGRIGGITA
ncbi:putative phage protein [Desulfovibrio sp. A2]|nr:putative phage protein [Desulfovibrio sp. A2]